MKRFVLGIGVLLLLFAFILGTVAVFGQFLERMTRELFLAEEASREGSISTAERHTEAARRLWDEARPLTAALCDHTSLEEIEELLTRLELPQEQENLTFLFTALTLRLTALEDAHKLTLQNLL